MASYVIIFYSVRIRNLYDTDFDLFIYIFACIIYLCKIDEMKFAIGVLFRFTFLQHVSACKILSQEEEKKCFKGEFEFHMQECVL